MKIAVISDTHSRASSVRNALAVMTARGIELILHCGDICDDDTVRLFPAHSHFVFGNCDFLRDEIEAAMRDVGATSHGAWGQLELAGRLLAFTHGDDHRLLTDLANANTFDFLFHGHTHIAGERSVGKTRVINPGALQRVDRRTFLILDLASGAAEAIEVE